MPVRPRGLSPLIWPIVMIGVLLASSCSSATAPEAEPSPRVRASAAALYLDHRPWWPTGFNAYQLATDWSVNAGCGAQVDLDAYFAAAAPRSLTRFSLFAALAVDTSTGLPDFRAVDAVFAAAARHQRMVLPVLTGGASPCEGDVFKQRDWYRSGWRTERAGPLGTFAHWIETAVTRWRDEASLAGWEPVGEPEPADCTTADCAVAHRRCAADAPTVLRTFFDEVGVRIRRLDPGRLIFSGTAGGDQCGTAGADYRTVATSTGVDVLDFHDYPEDVATPTPGSSLAARIAQAREVGKPLIVNEVGIRGGSCLSLPDRADRYRTRLGAIRAQGAAGALLWAYVPDPRTAECTYDIGPDDPAWAIVDRFAR